jgi:hypothetical protein
LPQARSLIDSASATDIPCLAEELCSYLASRSLPTDWLAGALASKVPGLADATTAARLKVKQYSVLAHNDHVLTNAFQKDVAAPPLLDPANVTADAYSDGSV